MGKHQTQRSIVGGKDGNRLGVLTTATMASGLFTSGVWSQGDDRIRVGLIGCGGRGSGAAANACAAAEGVELYALGDLFADRLERAQKNLSDALEDKYQVTPERCFVGFDAYQKVLATDVNYVILATPPGFRPMHFRAAVEAGKHVFMEKPVAVCPAGVREIIAAGELAKEKGLGVVAGTQYRHHAGYIELMKRLQEGEIGTIVGAQCYYNTGGLWKYDRQPGWSDVEWQIRNWLYFTWLSGDHAVEQHIHHVDTVNWALGSPPIECVTLGGRQVRTDPAYGHIYDHFVTDFTYPNGVKVMSMCRQMDNCDNRLGEHFIGTEGTADGPVMNPVGFINGRKGEQRIEDKGGLGMAYVREHADNINAIRAGEPLNEARQVAETTLSCIMIRMSAYSGKKVTWDFAMNESKLNLMEKIPTEFGDMPVDEVAMPGRTPLI
ncbi:MAG: Gfo/Idh/MocA family protein [Candidatus Zipacnadales bacterium]